MVCWFTTGNLPNSSKISFSLSPLAIILRFQVSCKVALKITAFWWACCSTTSIHGRSDNMFSPDLCDEFTQVGLCMHTMIFSRRHFQYIHVSVDRAFFKCLLFMTSYNTSYVGLRPVPSKWLARDISGSVWNESTSFTCSNHSIVIIMAFWRFLPCLLGG